MTDTAHPVQETHALLADGRTVEIRPTRPEDHAAVVWLFDRLSSENLRLRFFGPSRRAGGQTADRVCVSHTPGHRALLALLAGQVVGLAEYETGTGPRSAEIALTVADDLHHQGVGTLLLEHLVDRAGQDGITTFTAEALADNHPVLKVFADLGLNTVRHFDGTAVHCVIRLEPDEYYRAAVDTRGRTAASASLRALLRPESIAVIGTGHEPGSIGRAVLKNLRRAGFRGRLRAVDAHAHSVERIPCYPSVAALPHPVDLAVLAVPAAEVAATAEQCGMADVRALVVLATGLDAEQSAALLAVCRRYGLRLAGPNSMGVTNTEEPVRMDATFAAHRALPGTAGVGVQSGGIGIALLAGLSRLGIGVSTFASLGDKYDVSGNDLLQWWEGDGRTDLAVLQLESFGNPRGFSRTARRVARRMPVLTVDTGGPHPGRLSGTLGGVDRDTPAMTRQALFAQAGVTATRTLGELLDTAAMLHSQPLPPGTNVAVVSNSHGAGTMAADACLAAGLTVHALPATLAAELLELLPPGAQATNPVDVTAAVSEAALRACVERLAVHGALDAVMVVLVPTALSAATGDDLVRALTQSTGTRRSRTVTAVLLDQPEPVRLLHTAAGTIPAYSAPHAAARALAHAAARGRWLAQPLGTMPELPDIDTAGAHALVDAFLTVNPQGGLLDPEACSELLDRYGIPRPPEARADGEQSAAEAAVRLTGLGGHVALTAYGPGLPPGSGHDGVLLGLVGETEVRAAYRELKSRFSDAMTGVLVRPMVGRGIELTAGIKQDDVFGPLILCWPGGIACEPPVEPATRLAPLTDHDARALLADPRCSSLLLGRHGGSADIEGVKTLLLRLSRMAEDLPQLADAALDTVVAGPGGVTALDARIRLLPHRVHDPYLRRLR